MRTFRRLLGFLRPYRRPLIFSLVLAWLAMGMTVLIPLLIGGAVNAIEDEHRDDILPLVLALLGAGVLRLVLTVGRRLIAGKVSLAVEYDLRQLFYEHLQKLELGFFDSQQTGQLMSRATVDLQSIRFFLGYGLIWVSQSALTILFAAVAMFVLDPLLAAAGAGAGAVPGRDRDALQPPQPARRAGGAAAGRRADRERRGEHLGDPDREGVRARAAHARTGSATRSNRVFEQSMVSTRLQAFYTPLMGFLPNIGLAVVLLVGGLQVIHGSPSIGHFTAFYVYVVLLSGPVRWLGMSLSMAQRAVASGNRMFEILDREPSMAEPAGRAAAARRAADRSLCSG